MSLLLFDIKDHIATLLFNQPEKRPASWVAVDPDKLPGFGKRNANPFGNG